MWTLFCHFPYRQCWPCPVYFLSLLWAILYVSGYFLSLISNKHRSSKGMVISTVPLLSPLRYKSLIRHEVCLSSIRMRNHLSNFRSICSPCEYNFKLWLLVIYILFFFQLLLPYSGLLRLLSQSTTDWVGFVSKTHVLIVLEAQNRIKILVDDDVLNVIHVKRKYACSRGPCLVF